MKVAIQHGRGVAPSSGSRLKQSSCQSGRAAGAASGNSPNYLSNEEKGVQTFEIMSSTLINILLKFDYFFNDSAIYAYLICKMVKV
jgi:hypothetical protein